MHRGNDGNLREGHFENKKIIKHSNGNFKKLVLRRK
jgi:hypothetical protein